MEKFCKYCGNKINEDDKFCMQCGGVVEQRTEEVVEQQTNNNVSDNTQNSNATEITKTNGAAIGGFVCSLVGLLICGIIMGIIAICLSVSAKKHMEIFPNEKGKGLATAALVIGIIDVVFSFIGAIFKIMAIF